MAEVTYIDLVESIRKGKCRSGVERPVPWEYLRNLKPTDVRGNWAIPSYNFGTQLRNMPVEEQKRLSSIGRSLAERGEFMLPHECFALVMKSQEDDDMIIRVSMECMVNVDVKKLSYNPQFWADFYEHPLGAKSDFWIRSECTIDNRGVYSSDNSYDSLNRESSMRYQARGNVVMICVVLMMMGGNRRGIIGYSEPGEDNRWSFINRSRLSAGREEIPQTRSVLYLSTEDVKLDDPEPRTRLHASGWELPGHERQGHWRVYKTGKRRWIAPCLVKGGPAGVPPTRPVRLTPQT